MREMKKYLEAGQIVNTHGVRGEIKVQPWCNSPELFCSLKQIYIDGVPVPIRSARVHKGCAILALDGVSDIDGAIALKNKVVWADRADIPLPEGEYFIQDLIGLAALDDDGGELGRIAEVLTIPSGNVYVIRGEREILVPAVPEFIREVNIEAGFIRIHLIKGM